MFTLYQAFIKHVSIKHGFPQQDISIEIIRNGFIVSLEVAHIYIRNCISKCCNSTVIAYNSIFQIFTVCSDFF